ncbi:GDSL lipase/esterase [Gamsiella multidivaricata]|uniref:GDSL lipase/esterase n=1 Tax=Gamsiella multidivaricata TaxID=101098 RepID=UPI002220100D|nr:GDSL lipase/esterase [Gamsiella multidivaricata]KAG0360526.1 hypothetical protein BGZ54_009489 [Gamsiella multidivaricata]KAI7816287.1 GDSL lipase/esterase [Gamsiella multidivaricata]
MLFNLFSIAAVAMLASSVPSVMAKPTGCKSAHIENLVVFGDSYSDTGNVYQLSNKTWPLPFYDHGRFSNGRVWSEHVAKAKHYKLSNYAYGAATSDSTLVQGYSGPSATIPVPGFIQQIELYAPKSTREDAARTLFVVNFQGNDFFFNPSLDPAAVLAKLHEGIKRLVALGARNVLVVENIDLGALPYFNTNATNAAAFTAIARQEQEDYKGLKKQLTQEYGRSLDSHPFYTCSNNSVKVNVGYLNLGELYKRLYKSDQLKRLGITDVVQGCVSNDYKTECKNAGKYFYWDAFHPTAKIHKEIAEAVLHLL